VARWFGVHAGTAAPACPPCHRSITCRRAGSQEPPWPTYARSRARTRLRTARAAPLLIIPAAFAYVRVRCSMDHPAPSSQGVLVGDRQTGVVPGGGSYLTARHMLSPCLSLYLTSRKSTCTRRRRGQTTRRHERDASTLHVHRRGACAYTALLTLSCGPKPRRTRSQ
jgi:hypothetical protein